MVNVRETLLLIKTTIFRRKTREIEISEYVNRSEYTQNSKLIC